MKNKDSFSKTKLWKILTGLFLAVFLLALPLNLSGQTTVFSDNFSSASLSSSGTPALTYSTTIGTGSAITTGSTLDIKAAASAAGTSYVSASYPSSSVFNTTLGSNTGLVSWSFNVRQSKGSGNLGGFDATKYGVAVVLAASEANLLSATCNGYAVVCNGTAAPYVYSLVSFTGGLSANSKVTTFATGTLPGSTSPNVMNDYMSIMVTYDYSANTWKLYQRDDGATAFGDPATGTTLITTATNSTYTATVLANFGFLWNYGSAATQYKASLDNFKLTVNVPVSWSSGWPKAEVPTPTGFTAKVNLNVPGKAYYVILASGATAPTSAQVKAGLNASGGATTNGSITCAAGATEYAAAAGGSLTNSTPYDVYFVAEDASGSNLQSSPILKSVTTTAAATAPTISTPTATSITNSSATLGANITSDGGATITDRGTVWTTNTGVGIGDNKLDETGRTAGIFSHNRTSLPAKTQIFYKGYATNSVNTVLSSESSFYTLANEPTTQVTGLTATAASSSSINLAWTPAADADGYIILQRLGGTATTGSPADFNIYSIGNSIGNGTVAAYITGSATSCSITGLTSSTQYSYKVFSVNSDGVNAATYNYFTTSAPSASATTSAALIATYTWNQTGTASWATASNWTPNRTNPDIADILQFNGGGSIVVTNVPTQTIAQLLISNNTTIELQSTVAATLSIRGEAGVDFDVQTGSTLNLAQATNPIIVAIGAGATGSVAGSIAFTNSAHKLTANDASALTFQSGGIFTAGSGFTSNAFGAGTAGSVIFANGSKYYAYAGSNPFANASSIVVWQTGSTYVHKNTGSQPALSNRTYANFELDNATGTAYTSITPLTVDNLIVSSGSWGLGISNAFTINGNISIANGATLNLNPATAGTIALKGDINVVSGGILNVNPLATFTEIITLSGTGAQAINNAGTFSSTTDASYIVANSTGVNIASNVSFPTLTINSGAVLNVNAGKQLTVSSTLNNSGTLNILSTSADGTATCLTPTTLGGTGGTYNVSQYLTGGRNWYISSPISDATTAIFNPAGGSNHLYWYDEAHGSTKPWPYSTRNDSTLEVMRGYVANMAVDGAVTFNGTLNTGDKTILFNRTTGQTKEGFNLLGNPYTSYVNIKDIQTSDTVHMETSYWLRTRNAGNTNYVFDTYNLKSGIGITNSGLKLTKYIPPMQAFWVRVKQGFNSGSLTLHNSLRAHQDSVSNVFRAPSNIALTQQILRLQVSNGLNTDETVLYTNPNALNGFDDYDSQKMMNEITTTPDIYTLAGSTTVAINGMNSIPYESEMPIGFTANTSGGYSLKASQISNFTSGTQVILKDYLDIANPVITDLSDGKSYLFTSSVTTNNTSRFSITFHAPSIATGINQSSKGEGWILTRNGQIIVNGTVNGAILEVFNTIGQKVISRNLTGTNNTLNNNLSAGAYLVKLTNGGQNFSRKIIIN